MGGNLSSLTYILKTRGISSAESLAKYKDLEFKFRRCDVPALKEILATGEYDFLQDILKSTEAPIIYDIGAHIGLFSIWALSVNPNLETHSIEASPKTYEMLSYNVEQANKKGLKWSIQNRAAWKNHDDISFSNSLESSMSHRVDSEGKVKIKGLTFADLINRLPENKKIEIMKIDIEGAEEAFLCADNVNMDTVENLIIELHPQLCNTNNVIDILKKNFSKIEECHDDSLSKPLLFCKK